MNKTIRIGERAIGEGEPLFIIAEVGVTCNYDLALTRELIDACQEAGADAVKFIFWFPEEIMSDKTISYTYETADGPKTENMFQMLDQLRFSLDEWRQVKAHCQARGLVMFSTVNSPGGIDYAETLGLEAYKLSSWDYNYLPLWRRIAALGKPMIIDMGPVRTLDVAKVVAVVREAGNDQIVFLHNFQGYNHPEMNMLAIPYLRAAFRTLVGYSSPNLKDETDIMAVSLGAVVLEKRVTLSRKLPGHHHVLAKEPGEFKAYVELMRNVQAALGECDLRPTRAGLKARQQYFRQLVANRDLKAGTVLGAEMLEGKRPAQGVSPEHLDFFVGRQLKRGLKYNQAIAWDDV